jgi:ribosomal protein S18 acetylase RimI-like enzyme
MNVKIRPARPEDVAAIRACVEAAYTPYIASIGVRPVPLDDDYAALVAAGDVYVVPARDGEGVRAILVIRPRGGDLLIENVAVHPEYQGQGLGTALLAFAETVARERGLAGTTLYTNVLMTANIALYKHLGYEEIGRPVEYGFRRVDLRKQLPSA